MSNATKKAGFEEFENEWANDGDGPSDKRYNQDRQRDDTALPDDRPVMPEDSGNYIKRQKGTATSSSAMMATTAFYDVDDDDATDWIFYQSDVFDLARWHGV